MIAYLKTFIQEGIKKNASCQMFLLVIPLLHFLNDFSKPTILPEIKEHKTKEWWGLQDIDMLPAKLKPLSKKFVE